MNAILASLLPDVLEGWIGPVEVRAHRKFPVPLPDTAALELARGQEVGVACMISDKPSAGTHLPDRACCLTTGSSFLLRPECAVRLDPTRPEVRSRVATVLARGLRCFCLNGGYVGSVVDGPGDRLLTECRPCKGTGWLRQPVASHWLLPTDEGGSLGPDVVQHSPALLAWHARDIARSGTGLAGVLGPWGFGIGDRGWICRRAVALAPRMQWQRAQRYVSGDGRLVLGPPDATDYSMVDERTRRMADEASEREMVRMHAEMAAADTAARAAGYATVEADGGLVLPAGAA